MLSEKNQLSLTSMLSKSAMSKGVKTQAKNTDLGLSKVRSSEASAFVNFQLLNRITSYI